MERLQQSFEKLEIKDKKTQNFIEKAEEKHGQKYDYSKTIYKDRNTHITISCNECKTEFTQSPRQHLTCKREPCKTCYLNTRTQAFIEKAKQTHSDKYDYTQTIYTSTKKKVKIKCNNCGHEFEMTPTNHTNNKQGCPKRCRKLHSSKEFIKRAKEKHGDKYDYSLVPRIIKDSVKVDIKCNNCGKVHQQRYNNHLRCDACICHIDRSRVSQEEFVRRIDQIHGDKYDYPKVFPKGKYISIHCKKCNKNFNQSKYHHSYGSGCPRCSGKNMNNELFIERAREKHGDKYDYSDVIYLSTYSKVRINCKKCKTHFYQKPNDHLQGCGCSTCAKNKNRELFSHSKEQFINKAVQIHGDKYNYSEVNYVNNKTKVKIKCNKCSSETDYFFEQRPYDHLIGKGCAKCARNKKLTTQEFIQRAVIVHGQLYGYDKVIYKGCDRKVTIICKKCEKPFQQSPYNHLKGCGCRTCNLSKGELMVKQILEELSQEKNNFGSIKFEQEKTLNVKYKRPLRADFFLSEYNLFIEYDGIQHFEPIPWFGGWYKWKERQRRDKLKNKHCLGLQCSLLRITYKQDYQQVKELILRCLSTLDSKEAKLVLSDPEIYK